ncbi:MAG: MATE family efflux transporter [Ruminococcaceae bacterium]|nr:MATE family efflux transporter [Oscillospiraceae bacterium]
MSSSDAKFIKMTTEPVEKLVCKLALPTIISMLVTTFYNLADTFFVRLLDNDSMVAAVGVVLPLMNIIQAFGFFCGHGSGNYISRALGRRDKRDAEIMCATGFGWAIIIGLLIGIPGLIFREQLAIILGAKTEATLAATIDYMTWILLAVPFMTGAVVVNNQLRMQGNAVFAMVGLTSGAIINIILDPILIFGAGMGVAGAALATAISQFISFVLLLIGLNRSDNIKISFKNFTPNIKYFHGIVQGGLPSLARQGLASVAAATLNHAVGLYVVGDAMTDAVQAAMAGTSKLMLFLSSALIGFGQGFQPVCGFNYGAKKYERVKDAYYFCVKLSAVVLFVMAVIGFIFAEPIVSTVAGTSELAMSVAVVTFRAQLCSFPLMSWVILCNMLLQNIGLTFKATFVAAARQGLTFIPSVLILPLITGAFLSDTVLGLQLSQALSDLLAFVISLPIGLSVLKNMKEPSEKNV